MVFINEYYRLLRALTPRLNKIPEDVMTNFIDAMQQISNLSDTELEQLDKRCLEQVQLLEANLDNADTASGLGNLIFPFLAVHIKFLSVDRGNNDYTPNLTRFYYQSGKIINGEELNYLRNQFLEYLFSFNALPLQLRRWFFDQVVNRSPTLPFNLVLTEQSMTERMVTLAQRHIRNVQYTPTEIREIRRLVERNDLLTKSLLKEWGLSNNWFNRQILIQWMRRVFSRGNVRRTRLIFSKYTLMLIVVILYVAVALTTYMQWSEFDQQRKKLASTNITRWQIIETWLSQK